ncbi:hypothetical protein BJX66DRAFT_297371 [Aspergillus keveii]|uniref:Uncharacterized protein n=1 Tax=Aspergillus keveii TaxID=714993 RepID=A0ABR4GFX5_9EURO
MASYEGIPLESFELLEGVAPDNESPLHDQNAEAAEESHNTPSPLSASIGSASFPFPPLTASPLAIAYPTQDSNCYHSTVSRQCRINEYETCDSCGNRPHLRWFYLCTEDTSSYSNPANPNGSFLSPWITDAILAGEYTDAEREILFEQKLKVMEMCERGRRQAQAGPCFGHENKFRYNPLGLNPTVPQMPPRPARCCYRACPHCDHRLLERTWLSIDTVCNDPDIKLPSAWDLWETPVSDARLLSNIGLSGPPPPPPPPHFSQYVYRGVHSRRTERVSENYSADYDSSSDFSVLMSRLSAIEETSEETEIRVEMG